MIVLNEMVKHVHSITCELKLHTSPMQNKVSHKQLKRPICNAVPNAPLWQNKNEQAQVDGTYIVGIIFPMSFAAFFI
jgi:hypothetical protein